MASPTVATDLVFITVAVDVHEGQEMASFDIPGAYLHTETDEYVIILLEVLLAEIMVKAAPKIYL